MKYEIMDGNKACSLVAYKFSEACAIYPITPASTMAENMDDFASKGKPNFFGDKVKVVEMQSEAGAIATVHGMLLNGTLASTFTASQGLLLMIPNMYKIAGELLPGVINVAARTVATHALSIMGDHSDIYAARATGFAYLASSSVKDVESMTAVAYLSAIKGRVPFLNFFDGFRTSHEYNKVPVLDLDEVKKLIDTKALNSFRMRSLDVDNPVTYGTNQGDSIYFQGVESRNNFYLNLPDIVNNYMESINKIGNTSYKPFNYYGGKNATRVIVAMGSVCSTIKELLKKLKNDDLGMIEVHLYRPFSKKYFLDVLPKSVNKIACLDRTKEPGSLGEPLYLDVSEIIKQEYIDALVIGGRYGLSSKDTTLNDIEAIYNYLNKAATREFTIGIIDDVTNLSLAPTKTSFTSDTKDMLIYGYGSDGMVTASKDILTIIGDNTPKYVQGYFEYDSKKSGGLTISHLRFGDSSIDKPYYIKNAKMLVCSKDTYFKKYDMLSKLQDGGIFLLNTTVSKENLSSILTKEVCEQIKNKKIKFYIVNASLIAEENHIPNKISMIMEMCILKLFSIIDFEEASYLAKEMVYDNFIKKGQEIVDANLSAMTSAIETLEEVSYDFLEGNVKEVPLDETIFSYLDHNKGSDLKVSSFLNRENGAFEPGLSRLEKRGVADKLPCYDRTKCIGCNLCSFVCPHAVIRPYLLNEQEVSNAPESVKKELSDAKIKDEDLKFTIGVSPLDCTGCSLCAKNCPVKALEMQDAKTNMESIKANYDYLKNVTEKKVMPINTIKGSQFIKPKFEFSGACAGCGETPYLKLLSQLFGENLIIANATGCSSIYSSSVPNTPYSIPWANSLFEDNAEFAYGIKTSCEVMKDKISNLMTNNYSNLNKQNKKLCDLYLKEYSKENSYKVYEELDYNDFKEIIPYKKYIKEKNIWAVGGDGWAYDIGFSGIDHVMANNLNVNMLVLDTEVYSNTGGQASKSTRAGAVCKFASSGKQTAKKDLARIALTYPNCYVAEVSLGASPMQVIKAFEEANAYNGPSLIIAYAPCIAHGIKKGMSNSISEEKLATEIGYFPIFRYNPLTKEFILDSKADFTKYEDIFQNENRYRLKDNLKSNKENAQERYEILKKMQGK